jgi:integrase
MATKVKLRQKPISGNRESLYLDFYPAIQHPETGEPTRREFLGLYLHSDVITNDKGKRVKTKLTPIEKESNRETRQLAEQIRQKRDKAINGNEALTTLEIRLLEKDNKERQRGEQDFVTYFKSLADKRKASNHDNWVSAYNYLETFTGGKLKFADLSERVCNEFKDFLLNTKSNRSDKTTLAQNSALSYFNKFKATLKQAFKDGYLSFDLNSRVETIKQAETHRNFLNINELNALVKTPCPNPLLKRAALFSALTGLRFSDIKKLVWGEVTHIPENGHFLRFKQQKTKGVEMLPISEQAFTMLGETGKPTAKVFEGLTYSAYSNKHLYQWIGAAGITRDITFHCFRHTYAVLQLSSGTDIYTVSKMLGHRELKTTQVYAKVIDQTKRDAANKIKLEM